MYAASGECPGIVPMSEPFYYEYDVFLSHSTDDKPAVRELAERLKTDGLRVCFDEWEIQPGDQILRKIGELLEQSRTLVLIMSTRAFASKWATLESHMVLFSDPTNTQRRFIPLLLDNAEIPAILRQFAYVDWRQRAEEQYARLLAACRPPQQESPPKIAPEAEPLPV